jgi:hypothetical protein
VVIGEGIGCANFGRKASQESEIVRTWGAAVLRPYMTVVSGSIFGKRIGVEAFR